MKRKSVPHRFNRTSQPWLYRTTQRPSKRRMTKWEMKSEKEAAKLARTVVEEWQSEEQQNEKLSSSLPCTPSSPPILENGVLTSTLPLQITPLPLPFQPSPEIGLSEEDEELLAPETMSSLILTTQTLPQTSLEVNNTSPINVEMNTMETLPITHATKTVIDDDVSLIISKNCLTCPICHDLFQGTTTLSCPQCSNCFCSVCLTTFYTMKEIQNERGVCPLCKFEVQIEFYQPNRIIDDILSNLRVLCRYSENGCPSEKTIRENIDAHERNCPYQPVVCRNSEKGCKWSGTLGSFEQDHITTCVIERYVNPTVELYEQHLKQLENANSELEKRLDNLEKIHKREKERRHKMKKFLSLMEDGTIVKFGFDTKAVFSSTGSTHGFNMRNEDVMVTTTAGVEETHIDQITIENEVHPYNWIMRMSYSHSNGHLEICIAHWCRPIAAVDSQRNDDCEIFLVGNVLLVNEDLLEESEHTSRFFHVRLKADRYVCIASFALKRDCLPILQLPYPTTSSDVGGGGGDQMNMDFTPLLRCCLILQSI